MAGTESFRPVGADGTARWIGTPLPGGPGSGEPLAARARGIVRRGRPKPRQRREDNQDRTERAVTERFGSGAERAGVPGAAGMPERPTTQAEAVRPCDPVFQHGVVVGFDGSLSSERALAYAVGMARRSQCGLVIVHVANRLPATVWAGCEPPVFVDLPDHRTEVIGLELACADFLSGVPWILVERGGDICHEIEEVGREYAADAIVVGSTHGLLGKIFGSVSGRLARRANRPVIVIP